MKKKHSILWRLPIEEIQAACDKCTSLCCALRHLGYSKTSAAQGSRLRFILNERGVKMDHFLSHGENISKFQRSQSEILVNNWLDGKIDGHHQSTQNNLSPWARRYLMDKFNNKCQKCGWGEKNNFTGLVPLHIHHVDGISTNSRPDNLEVLCPNCHSLTENFGSRNKKCSRNHKHRLMKQPCIGTILGVVSEDLKGDGKAVQPISLSLV